MKSNLWAIDWSDVGKGLVMAVISTIISYGSNLVNLSDFNWQQIISIVVITSFTYLAKNFVTDEDDKVLGKF